ncbi:MAG: FAD-dependent oxidoreductase [Bacteriovoracaceae bacterium]|nr:FAD-dependent oxidoreductase [Bacteriovoracaceae bacterium]
MKNYDIIIVGGSAAGVTAAITARRYHKEKSILLIRKEDKVPIPCGIPYVFGTVTGMEKNIIPDAVLDTNKVDLKVAEVVSIDSDEKIVTTVDNDDFRYEKLILATGSNPIIPPIDGIDKNNIFPIYKNVDHLGDIFKKLTNTKNLVVIGGGFIGVEFAEECLKNRKISVTLVEMLPGCLMTSFDKEISDKVNDILTSQNISLKCNRSAKAFVGEENVKGVKLENGEVIDADCVILGIGAVPNIDLAKSMELKMGPSGGIWVDKNMKTSAPDIFACGDCADSFSFFTGKPSKIRLASTAAIQARIAGANLYNTRRAFNGTIGVFSTALSDTAFACAGLTEHAAKEEGYDIITGEAEGPNRHPGAMPGMQQMKVKLIFDKCEKTLLGGQVSGAYSSGEVINLISSLILSKSTADDIAMFQLGTHPALTASPIAYQLVNAAEAANVGM